MNHSTKKPTKAEQARLDAIHGLTCLACDQQIWAQQPFVTEAHHLVDKGTRKHSGGHMATIPLDGWHHRGICIEGWSSDQMKRVFGPSLALHKKQFVAEYGSERELLAKTDKLLERYL